MRYHWLDPYLCAKRSVTKDVQPVWNWVRYKIGGKMFAAICLDEKNQPYYINLKVDPAEAEFLRKQYADILPGYYSDKRTWISIQPDGAVPDDLLRDLLDRAYRLMLQGFSKKRQRELLHLSCCGTDCDGCEFYHKHCAGCNECGGRVFHAPPGKVCPIYACSVQKHRYVTCVNCKEMPCALWQTTRDPQFSDQAFEQSIQERIQNLKEI